MAKNTARTDRNQIAQAIQSFCKQKNLSANTVSNYGRIITNFAKAARVTTLRGLIDKEGGALRLAILDFISLAKSANSKKITAACLRSFFGWLSETHGIKNPVPTSKALNLPTQSKSNTESFDLAQLQDILARLRQESPKSFSAGRLYVLCLLLSSTSLRISEALQITVEMVKSGNLAVTQKRGRAREIELPEVARLACLAFADKYNLAGYLFVTDTGKTLSRVNAWMQIKKATGACCHAFRKSVVEILAAQGVHPHEIAKVTGHASLQMVYYYDNTSAKPQAHKALCGLLG